MNDERTVSINYATGAVTPAIQALEDEFDLIYAITTKLRGLNAGAAPPASPNAGDLWFDTRPATFGLKYWVGPGTTAEDWSAVAANGNFASGVQLDAGLAGMSSGAVLSYPGTGAVLYVVGSASSPAIVAIEGELLRNVSTVQAASFASDDTGLYHLYAYRESSTSTTWRLGKASSNSTTSGRRYIGLAYWDKTAGKIAWVESFERPSYPEKIPGLFHYKQTVAQQISQDVETVISFTPATDLVSGSELLMPAADGVIVLNRAGAWEVSARFRIDNGTGTHIDTEHHTTTLWLRHYTGATVNAEDYRVERRGSGLKEVSTEIRGSRFYAAAGDLVKASVLLNPDNPEPHFHTLPSGTQIWGRYLGPA